MWISSRITTEMIIPTCMRDCQKKKFKCNCLLINDYLLVGILLMINFGCLQ